MRDYSKEFADRVQYIRSLVETSGVDGIVFGNSGGKDSALVGILCKFACENTVGIMMPCASKRNFEQDMKDAKEVAEHFGIESRVIDLTDVRQAEIDRLQGITTLTNAAGRTATAAKAEAEAAPRACPAEKSSAQAAGA